MATIISFTCDVCGRAISPTPNPEPKTSVVAGYGLRWSGAAPLPLPGDTLKEISEWTECGVHLCRLCVDAIVKFSENRLG